MSLETFALFILFGYAVYQTAKQEEDEFGLEYDDDDEEEYEPPIVNKKKMKRNGQWVDVVVVND